MKKILIGAIGLVLVPCVAFAQLAKPYYVEITPVTSTYVQKTDGDGMVYYEKRPDISLRATKMGFSGTSTCAVIDTTKMAMADGYFTFQFNPLSGATKSVPLTGTTITVAWKGSNVDNPVAWALAPTNTIINGINALSGATSIVYDMNSIGSGVTPYRFIRFQYTSGVSAQLSGNGNLIPIGILHVR